MVTTTTDRFSGTATASQTMRFTRRTMLGYFRAEYFQTDYFAAVFFNGQAVAAVTDRMSGTATQSITDRITV